MKTVEIKETKKLQLTVEGNRVEPEVPVQFKLEEFTEVAELVEWLQGAEMEQQSKVLATINTRIKADACYKVAKYTYSNENDDTSFEIPELVTADYALAPVEGGRFSYRKAAEQAREAALELVGKLAGGEIDQAEFLQQHTELMSKAAEMDQKADEQAAARKPRTKKQK